MPCRTSRLPVLVVALVMVAFAAPSAEAAFPGSNGAIAYAHWDEPFGDDPDSLQVRTLAPGTTSHVRIFDTPDAGEFSPAYSPDGTQLAWVVSDRLAGIYVAPVDGGTARRIVASSRVSEPSWTAAGDRVVFSDAKRGIQSVTLTGGERTTLIGARRGWTASGATFSSDGTRIAYGWYRPSAEGTKSLRAEIWTAKADGTGARRILGGGSGPLKRVGEPDFSPDGSSLAMVTLTENLASGRSSIYVTATDGSDPRRVARVSNRNIFGDVVWSPDGQQLLTSRVRIGRFDDEDYSIKVNTTLLTIDPTTGAQNARLRVPEAMGFGVAWQPLPAPVPPAAP